MQISAEISLCVLNAKKEEQGGKSSYFIMMRYYTCCEDTGLHTHEERKQKVKKKKILLCQHLDLRNEKKTNTRYSWNEQTKSILPDFFSPLYRIDIVYHT